MIERLGGREKTLELLGWTEPNAEMITLVCLHSGVFTLAASRPIARSAVAPHATRRNR